MIEGAQEPRLVGLEHVQKILAATGLPLARAGTEDELRDAVNDAGCWYATTVSLARNYRFGQVSRDLDRLATVLSKAVVLLRRPEVAAAVYESYGTPPSPDAVAALLSRVEGCAKVQHAAHAEERQHPLFEHSPFEWLVGRHLAKAYRQAFNREAKVSTTEFGLTTGPFTRFCTASLLELGITKAGKAYKPAAIAEALRKVPASFRKPQSSLPE